MNRLQGRAVIAGDVTGPAAVSRTGFNAFASFIDHFVGDETEARCCDAQNTDLYGELLTGRVICAPNSVGSTSAGPCWERIAERGLAPAAMLLTNDIDSLTAGGLILADIWLDTRIVCVDRLGDQLLELVTMGTELQVTEDGVVTW